MIHRSSSQTALIRAAVEAYGAGLIGEEDWPAPDEKTKDEYVRHAPSFVAGVSSRQERDHPYTAQTIGPFLGLLRPTGRVVDRLVVALDALELIEQKYLRDSELNVFDAA